MKIRFLILAILLIPAACDVSVGQANVLSGVVNTPCCTVREFAAVSKGTKAEEPVNNPAPYPSPSANSTPSVVPSPVSTNSPSPTPSPIQSGGKI